MSEIRLTAFDTAPGMACVPVQRTIKEEMCEILDLSMNLMNKTFVIKYDMYGSEGEVTKQGSPDISCFADSVTTLKQNLEKANEAMDIIMSKFGI